MSHGYTHGCRCLRCRLDHRILVQDWWRRSHGKKPQPRLTAIWKRAYEKGLADDLCNEIIWARPLPDSLVQALIRLDKPTDRWQVNR